MKDLDCATAEEYIVRSFDKSITPKESWRLANHLRNCPHCTQIEKEYAELFHRIREMRFPEPETTFWTQFETSLNHRLKQESSKSFPQWSWSWLPAAAAIALAMVCAVHILPFSETKETNLPLDQTTLSLVMDELSELFSPYPRDFFSKVAGENDTLSIQNAISTCLHGDSFIFWLEMENETYDSFL